MIYTMMVLTTALLAIALKPQRAKTDYTKEMNRDQSQDFNRFRGE